MLEAAGNHRALVGTMMLGGLRVGELIALRWRDVDLAGGTIRVTGAKTDAGVRVIEDMSPMLREELTLHRADSSYTKGPTTWCSAPDAARRTFAATSCAEWSEEPSNAPTPHL